ncbi:hypothetical protein K6335_002501 [Vibrio parahaemolyticus]|nr:hypothetical protein [Vibrio parahaemolyticus]
MSKRDSTSYHDSLSGVVSTPESIEKLISLAEDISDKLHEMDDKINLIKQRLYWVVGLAYLLVIAISYLYLFLDKGSYGALVDIVLGGASLLSVIPSTIFFLNMRREQSKLNKEMRVEESVLNELLDMIYELDNSNTFNSFYDPVSQAAIRIRLKRLKFSR